MDPGSIAYFPEGTRYGPQKALSAASARSLARQRTDAGADSPYSGIACSQRQPAMRGMIMKRLKPIAAALLAALALSACVGFVVPVPVSDSNSSQNRR